ncbi:S-layer homology domain-containing protein [Brevibacillus humidisoli]|uniref:S-layer homology domain-containing protein n=1 Tax=Brevibacillus humidisoli TaxID=2895522 RepID=UPI001E3F3DCA|nr:S-layer homology domain-containing protein [Brevibacillus humidisoli]UFJ41221.1 S-layer homology domain-containing protein [Brevibacillus humidisoli]
MRTILWLVLGLSMMWALPGFASASAGAPVHWAADAAAVMQAIGAEIPEGSLDKPIEADEWERMVTVVFAPVLAEKHKDYHYWINAYTHLQLQDGKIERRWAVGGLVKLLNAAGKAPGSFSAKEAQLDLVYADVDQIGEENNALWEVAYQLGLVKGYPGDTLSPSTYLTYAEAAVLLDRAFELVSQQRFGYISALSGQQGQWSASLDEAKWLTDEQAIKTAMIADGRCDAATESCTAPNGFYIQNESETYEPVALSPEAVILVWGPESADGSKRVTLSDFQTSLTGERFADGFRAPYHLYLHNGAVVKIVEQYLP